MSEDAQSASIRSAAFHWLRSRVDRDGDILLRTELEAGFLYQGEQVRLVGPQGIFKPAPIKYYPLSITTTAKGPYKDAFSPDGEFLMYSYRGTNPNHHENKRLRDAMCDKVPLIYFHSTMPGHYLAIFPAFIVGDDPGRLTFTVAADDVLQLRQQADDVDDKIRRGYITRQVRQRIHQRTFRDRVLAAYQEQCTICHLRHANLLDAAHIVPDADEAGEPVVSNGLSLCKLHHAAYDKAYFGIRPDYQIEVRRDILLENDGPMLRHGLKEIHGAGIILPSKKKDRPDPQRLEQRYEQFRASL